MEICRKCAQLKEAFSKILQFPAPHFWSALKGTKFRVPLQQRRILFIFPKPKNKGAYYLDGMHLLLLRAEKRNRDAASIRRRRDDFCWPENSAPRQEWTQSINQSAA
jgi:hypothetical protein